MRFVFALNLRTIPAISIDMNKIIKNRVKCRNQLLLYSAVSQHHNHVFCNHDQWTVLAAITINETFTATQLLIIKQE